MKRERLCHESDFWYVNIMLGNIYSAKTSHKGIEHIYVINITFENIYSAKTSL